MMAFAKSISWQYYITSLALEALQSTECVSCGCWQDLGWSIVHLGSAFDDVWSCSWPMHKLIELWVLFFKVLRLDSFLLMVCFHAFLNLKYSVSVRLVILWPGF